MTDGLDLVRVRLVKEAVAPYSCKISSPEDAVEAMKAYLGDMAQECVSVIFLDTKNTVLSASIVSLGGINSAQVPAREIMQHCLLANASAFIMMHNHPSGDPTPSAEDIAVTKRLSEAAKLLSISLTDHIVVGNGTWFSFSEHKFM